MQCCQTGKEHIVKIKDLSKEDAGPLIPQDFISGSCGDSEMDNPRTT